MIGIPLNLALAVSLSWIYNILKRTVALRETGSLDLGEPAVAGPLSEPFLKNVSHTP